MKRYFCALAALVSMLLVESVTLAPALKAQIPDYTVTHNSGQSVQPAFDGWEKQEDGTVVMWFGYLNRNWEEEVDVLLGPGNSIDPGGDQGQPTHFYPRRHRFVFKVPVPKGWDASKRMTWTLTSHGVKNTAGAFLEPTWEVNKGVIEENTGTGGVPAGDNQPPKVSGDKNQNVRFGQAATLVVTASDDGIPKPGGRRGGGGGAGRGGPPLDPLEPHWVNQGDERGQGAQGVWIRWIHYRGPGKVTFDPESTIPVYGVPVTMTTKATFSQPGTYVLRAIASDSVLETPFDVTVTVTAAGSTQDVHR